MTSFGFSFLCSVLFYSFISVLNRVTLSKFSKKYKNAFYCTFSICIVGKWIVKEKWPLDSLYLKVRGPLGLKYSSLTLVNLFLLQRGRWGECASPKATPCATRDEPLWICCCIWPSNSQTKFLKI